MRKRAEVRGRQSGAVLILMVLIVGALSAVAVECMRLAQVELSASLSARNRRQAEELLTSGSRLAALYVDRDGRGTAYDHPGEGWAKAFQYPWQQNFATGRLSGKITDEHGRFPINRVVGSKEAQEALARLMTLHPLRAKLPDARAIVQSLVDYMDKDTKGSYEASAYRQRQLKREPPNRPLASVAEMRMVIGVNARVYDHLKDRVSVHTEKVNINAAPVETLYALCSPKVSTKLADRAAKAMVDYRRKAANFPVLGDVHWYKKLAEWKNLEPLPSGLITVKSDTFRLLLTANCGGVKRRLCSVLRRTNAPRPPNSVVPTVHVLHQERS